MNQTWKFAEITVRAEFNDPYLLNLCRLYEVEESPDLLLSMTAEDIEFERRKSTDGSSFSDGYLESLAFYRKFAVAALDYGVLLMHGSAICYHNKGYLYTAPSGTGKSTHSRLCREAYGDEVSYINDDKPLLRRINGVWYAYGTPWDGKHRLSENVGVSLGGICKLERGEENAIQRLKKDDALCLLMGQVYRPNHAADMKKAFDLMASLSKIPFWRLRCNVSQEAARLSLGTMETYKEELAD